MDENMAIPMDGAVEYDGSYSLPPEGEYFFTVVDWKKVQTQAKGKMPNHINIKFKLDLENADGQRGTVWDNLRMYQKWVWKYAEIAKAIGHTSPDSTQIRIDWSRFVGASGKVRLSHRVWEKDDGTKETQADLKYIIPSADQTGELAF